ncbi:dnaJ homolog subfamily C member 8-like isoform X2 [Gigantopelta aegis]|uniref:dnaJ homolog subfamily C member 8-like isoform X2 n=1 Tax=Gigantopelta aegis TaxID=1735272 RepID=UPI001B88A1E9|nr:dnaJ homolog subfamily C member 8-like isoform X2 [Gigantopelta aegis]
MAAPSTAGSDSITTEKDPVSQPQQGEQDANTQSNNSDVPKVAQSFDEFYSEVKAIEERDSVLTSKQQIDRLNRPGSTYFNLNPFDVLQIDPDIPFVDIKKKYRQMSILVHPDKNQDNVERSQKAFEAVNKAYKTLENEEGYKRCKEIVDEAIIRTDEMIKQKKKQLKKEGKHQDMPEDDITKYKHSVYVQVCKLFADLERLRQEREAKAMHERLSDDVTGPLCRMHT